MVTSVSRLENAFHEQIVLLILVFFMKTIEFTLNIPSLIKRATADTFWCEFFSN